MSKPYPTGYDNYPPVMSQPGYAAPGSSPHQGPPYPQPGVPGYLPPGGQGYPPGPQGYNPGYPPVGQQGQGGPCPPGLQYLTAVDQLLVKQTVEIFEAFTGFETNNKYKIQNSLGQRVYMAREETDCCTRNMCGPIRPFNMTICDNGGQEVIHINRPLACQSCCFPCCLQTLEVQSPPGTVIGTVEQDWSIIYPKFTVKDENGQPMMRIEGPCWTCSCFGDVEFKVFDDSHTQIGMISKQWSGIGRELFTDADNFGVSFPLDLPVKMKATLLGAVFLIDFMYFETQNQNNRRFSI